MAANWEAGSRSVKRNRPQLKHWQDKQEQAFPHERRFESQVAAWGGGVFLDARGAVSVVMNWVS